MADKTVGLFGKDGARELVKAVKDAVTGKAGGKTYNVSVEKFM
jgi:hypothetical protein